MTGAGLQEIDAAMRSLALSSPRIAAAFLILPLLSKDDAPALVRNTIYVALTLSVTPFLGNVGAMPHDPMAWAGILLKELFLGAAIGFSFASVLWSVAMAGDMIDTKVGASMASIVDPLGGFQNSLTGALLVRFANCLFLAVGGLTIFLDVLLGSYQVWPVHSVFPNLSSKGLTYFANGFGAMMAMAFMLAAPALILMSMIDLALGIMNRYAPQLNVQPITMALKAWVSSGVTVLGLATFVAVMMRSFDSSRGLLRQLSNIFN
jgi:type III secretion protein T